MIFGEENGSMPPLIAKVRGADMLLALALPGAISATTNTDGRMERIGC
jgi:hypothetical protein